MEIANVIGDDTYQALTGFALVRNPFSTLESFFRWIRRIFSFNARKNNLDINELRRIIANEDQRAQGFHFSGWGTAKAFALHDEFNDFVAASLENRYIPLMPMADRLGVGTHLEPRHIYRLSEIEQFWRALEGHLGRAVPHLHANRSKKKEILRWSEENIQQTSQHFAKDIDVFKMPQRPLNPSE